MEKLSVEELEDSKEIKTIFEEKVGTFLNKDELKQEMKADKILRKVTAYVLRGWPTAEVKAHDDFYRKKMS